MFAMTTGRYVLFLASFLIVKTEAIEDERLSSSSRLFQPRDLSSECSDITSLLTKLISDLEDMKGQIFKEIPEQLVKQAEETKKIANDLHTVKNDLHTLKGVEKKQVDDPEEIKMTLKKFDSNDKSACNCQQDLRKIQSSVDNITDRTCQISNILQQHNRRLQNFIQKACPYGFDYMPDIDQCLHLNLELKTWDNARSDCARMKTGAQMVSIKDSTKQEAVRRYLQDQFTKKESAVCVLSSWPAGGKIAWVVGQTRNPTQCGAPYFWKPVGAAETPFNYTNWQPGLPNCGSGHQNCAFIASSPQFDYRWDDSECDTLLCSLCEVRR